MIDTMFKTDDERQAFEEIRAIRTARQHEAERQLRRDRRRTGLFAAVAITALAWAGHSVYDALEQAPKTAEQVYTIDLGEINYE